MKKIISLILILILLLSIFSACNNQTNAIDEKMPLRELPKYPNIKQDEEGYEISGRVTDFDANGLYGASILVNGKVMALSDEKGYYNIQSLHGISNISVKFYDYAFKNAKVLVNSSKTNLNFEGETEFKAEATVKTLNGATLWGVTYFYNEIKRYPNFLTGISYNINNTGKTTITPSLQGFKFYPESVDVYTSNVGKPVVFTAVSLEDTFSITGVMNFVENSELSEISIYVDGKKYTTSVISELNGVKRVTYKISGLPYKSNSRSYIIKAGNSHDGFLGLNSYQINSERTNINFNMVPCKDVEISLDFPNGQIVPNKLEYYLTITDREGNVVCEREKHTNSGITSATVYEGCKIMIESKQFSSSNEVISSSFMKNRWAKNVSIECDMR